MSHNDGYLVKGLIDEASLSGPGDAGKEAALSDTDYEKLLAALNDDVETPAHDHTFPNKPSLVEDNIAEPVIVADEDLRVEQPVPIKKDHSTKLSQHHRIKNFFDPKIWPTHIESLEEKELYPKKIYIGLLNNIRKKDLIGYIDEWIVDNNCNRSSCAYQVVPYMGGFAFEVHEGGAGRGTLQKVLRSLAAEEEITVPSNDRYVRVAKKHDGFSVYLLNEFEKHDVSACVEFRELLSPVYKRNHGLMLTGVISSLFASVFFLSTWFMVYTVYNKDKVAVFTPSKIELPSQQINKITDIAKREDAYLKSLVYANGKWKINLETVKVEKDEAPAQAPIDIIPVNNDQPQAKVDVQLIQLHHDLVQTLAEQQQ
jgi:hypothetical protein